MRSFILSSALAAGVAQAYTVTTSDLFMLKNIDPIVFPGQYTSHMHSFFGSDAINVNTTTSAELRKGCSSTGNPNDFSAYWIPALYHVDNGNYTPITPMRFSAYYVEIEKAEIPYPENYKDVAGNASATAQSHVEDRAGISWFCEGQATDEEKDPAAFPTSTCDTHLQTLLLFHDCANPDTFESAYSGNPDWYEGYGENYCPVGMKRIPQLRFSIRYDLRAILPDGWDGKPPLELACGESYCSHGDFINAWDPEAAAHMLDSPSKPDYFQIDGPFGAGDEGPVCGEGNARDSDPGHGTSDYYEKPADSPEDDIRCRMKRVKLLPGRTVRPDGLPANYIDCEHWVTKKMDEKSRDELLEVFGAALAQREMGGHRAARHVSNGIRLLTHQPRVRKDDMFIPVLALMDLVTQDDIISAIENQELHHNFQIRWPLNDNDEPIAPEEGHVARVPIAELPPFYSPQERRADAFKDHPNNYLAMSYAWGDPEGPKRTIFLNGHPIEVGINLVDALRRFRKMQFFQDGGKIWIDALSINQNDPLEKGKQVQLMGRIYQEAGNIIVWLGEEDEESNFAITILENLSKMQRAEYAEVFDNSDPILAQTWRDIAQLRMKTALRRFGSTITQGAVSVSDILDRDEIHEFFNRPYWRRLWIIQELTNGRAGTPIVCGSRVTQWRYVRDAVIAYTDLLNAWQTGTSRGVLNDHMAYHIANIAKLEIRAHRKRPRLAYRDMVLPLQSSPGPEEAFHTGSGLREALRLASNTDVTEPKDRVYGMLHIPSLPKLDITVDYSKPVGDVYRDFAKACIEKGSPRDILFLLDGRGMSLPGQNGDPRVDDSMASWVPDFGASRASRPGMIEGDWYASNNPPTFQRTVDVSYGLSLPILQGNELLLPGFVADIVVGVGAVSPLDLDQDDRPWPSSFQKGIVQPGPIADQGQAMENTLNSMINGYDTSIHRQQGQGFLAEKDPDVCWVLVAGSMVGGARGGLSHRDLLSTFPEIAASLSHPQAD
ncbi:hypothetical protein FE257_001240 [Aspergillus nanangensis]|uniref:DUF1996 domain-containing protein n=1 Tax=Aspergillus nanangensis TaxID=2582783 RepID=A0AAD4CE44_ASPNN|nr:hypothetical protein FE257_001240 [Aspergillus nanangensis]